MGGILQDLKDSIASVQSQVAALQNQDCPQVPLVPRMSPLPETEWKPCQGVSEVVERANVFIYAGVHIPLDAVEFKGGLPAL